MVHFDPSNRRVSFRWHSLRQRGCSSGQTHLWQTAFPQGPLDCALDTPTVPFEFPASGVLRDVREHGRDLVDRSLRDLATC